MGPANGDAWMFVFRADASYVKAFQSVERDDKGCATSIQAQEWGRVDAGASSLRLIPDMGRVRLTAECAPERDADELCSIAALSTARPTAGRSRRPAISC